MTTDEQNVDDQTDTQDQGSENEESVAQEEKSAADYLAEFETSEAEEKKPDLKVENDDVDRKAREAVRSEIQDKEDRASAIKAVKGDLAVSDDFVMNHLIGLASNPAFDNAWKNRASNPKAWQGLLSAVKKDFSKEFSTDNEATETRKKVTSAVKASTASSAQEPKDAWGMSSSDFRKNARTELEKAIKSSMG